MIEQAWAYLLVFIGLGIYVLIGTITFALVGRLLNIDDDDLALFCFFFVWPLGLVLLAIGVIVALYSGLYNLLRGR